MPVKYEQSPMLFIRYTEEFKEVDYALPLQGAFDLTTPLEAILREATAKGKGVLVQVALVPIDKILGENVEDTNDQGTDGSNTDPGK